MAEKTKAELAYDRAVELVEETRRTGGTEIDFDKPEYHALTRIPDGIAGIKWLMKVNLNNTQVSNLAPLAGLTWLTTLYFNQTQVSDLAPLVGLTGLKWLALNQTQISDLAPLASLTGLTGLGFTQTQVSDLAPLAGLTGLIGLTLTQTQVSDLAPLAGLTELEWLYLNQTKASDLAPLARLTGLEWLYVDQTQVSDLAPLAGLTGLRGLHLSQTQVSDLAPLAGLTGLTGLALHQTQVSDLRPIRDLPLSGERPWSGLRFANTPASARDPELTRLAAIEDDNARTEQTLAYLKTLPPWPEPLPWLETTKKTAEPPEQDPALPLIWGEGGFSFLARSVDADPVTLAALDDLRSVLEDLRRKGNRHDDLYRLAGELQDRSKGDIADLKMVSLHLSYQKLRRLYQSRGARVEAFDDETTNAIGNALEILPGVTLADPGVETLIKRQEADRLAGAPPDRAEAEEAVLVAVQGEDAPFAPEVKDAARVILEPDQDDRLAGTRGLLSRNSLIAVLRFLRYDPLGAGITASVIYAFAINHGGALLTLAQTMGTDAFLWAQMVLSTLKAEYQATIGLAREAMSSGKLHLPKRKDPK